MTPKIIKISLFISILTAPGYFKALLVPSLLAQTDSITNERIPVKAKQLEAHWDVDCDEILLKTQQYLDGHGNDSDQYARLYDDIKKCIHIYNTPGSAHYQAEPDFARLLDQLNQPE